MVKKSCDTVGPELAWERLVCARVTAATTPRLPGALAQTTTSHEISLRLTSKGQLRTAAANTDSGNFLYWHIYSNVFSQKENRFTLSITVSSTRLAKAGLSNIHKKSELPGVLAIVVDVMTPVSLRWRAFVAVGVTSFRWSTVFVVLPLTATALIPADKPRLSIFRSIPQHNFYH